MNAWERIVQRWRTWRVKKRTKASSKSLPNYFILRELKKPLIFFKDRDISAINATAQLALERALARMEGMRWHEEERKVKS